MRDWNHPMYHWKNQLKAYAIVLVGFALAGIFIWLYLKFGTVLIPIGIGIIILLGVLGYIVDKRWMSGR